MVWFTFRNAMRISEFSVSRFAARWLPAIILVSIAGNQVRLVHSRDLSPWRGGGFGLFSTIDRAAERRISCVGIDAGGEIRVLKLGFTGTGPEHGFGLSFRKRLQALPDREQMERLGEMLLGADFLPAGERFYRLRGWNDRGIPAGQTRRLTAVRIAVWKLRFEPGSLRMRWEQAGPMVEMGD